MPFQKIESEKLASAVVRQIENLIVEGVLRPGERLPSERELSERLAVSRPSLREAVLMHAVPRLVFGKLLPNIQTSWVKMGSEGATLCLQAGANDLGGTLMYESITRAAGGANGQLMNDEDLRTIATAAGRPLQRRTTVYRRADEDQTTRTPESAAFAVATL